uniref:Uncharacterized protein n=2 Tax=Oryza sativa subsp. japonica TaxID=39947 RepID=Q2R806_ORYSJ|nr:hypothetical protein LOC_Os11g14310 [Oryza sativa Japonica Group]AAX96754.1 hypothetical protein [Oryza sativa Japonica Group]ABA92363.1 hypothetical protein LOC_Os11g14310 [Oryza sativa Japonica Group]
MEARQRGKGRGGVRGWERGEAHDWEEAERRKGKRYRRRRLPRKERWGKQMRCRFGKGRGNGTRKRIELGSSYKTKPRWQTGSVDTTNCGQGE